MGNLRHKMAAKGEKPNRISGVKTPNRSDAFVYLFTLLPALVLILGQAAFVFAQTPAKDNLTALSLEDLMNIRVTSVSRKPQNLSDSAAAIFVITHDDLIRSGATCIPEALRMVPGLYVARIDANKWAVSSRGFNSRFSDKLLVLIDGRTVYTPSFSGVYWEVQDVLPEDVERIEVIRGPGATLWGANAVNGVINIITRHAADTTGGLASAGGGNADRAFGSARYGASLGKGTYGRIFAKYIKRDSFENPAGGDAGDEWDIFHTGFRMDSKKRSADNFTFQGDLYTGDGGQRLYGVASAEPPYSRIVDDDIQMSGGNLLARWQHIFSFTSDLTFQAYYDRTNREDIYIREKRDSFDLDFQHHFAASDRQDVLWGLRYRYSHDNFSRPIVAEIDPDSRGAHLFSAFIQDEIAIVDKKLWLILGAKFEHNEYTGCEIQPSGRLSWAPHSHHRLWAAVSRAVRTPSRIDHNARINAAVVPSFSPEMPLPVDIILAGNPSLDSEELIAYEAGYRFLPGNEFSFDISIFYNNYKKLRKYVPAEILLNETRIEQINLAVNGNAPDSTGLEVSAVWQPAEWLKLNTAYSFLSADLNNRGIGGKNPGHQVSLRAVINPLEDVDIDVWLRYVGDAEANLITPEEFSVYEIDDYMTLDLRMAWRLTENLELIAVGQNLMDKGHVEFTQEMLIAPTEVPRSFYGQIKYSF